MIRNVRLLYIHNFLNDFRFQEAFLVIYFAQITGSYIAAMGMLALATITSALMDIPTGIFSDKIGRKSTIIIASFFSTLTVICYALADSTAWLYIGTIFSGLSECLFNGNNNALLYESLKTEKQEARFPHYQGRTRSMFQLALGLSALGASFLTGYGLRFIFILGIIPQALSIFVSLFFQEPRVHIPADLKKLTHLKTACLHIYHNPRLCLLMIAQAISYGAGESSFKFRSAFVNMLWPTWAVGLYRAGNHAFGFIGYWFSGPILDRIKGPHMMALAETYWFISQGVAALMANVISPVLMLTGAALYGPFIVARDHLLQKEFTDAQRATIGSIATFLGSVVFAFVALCIGFIADRFGLAAGVGFGVVASVISLPLYIHLFRRYF